MELDEVEEVKPPEEAKKTSAKRKKREKGENNKKCSECKRIKGSMLLCSRCPKSYHFECAGVQPEDAPIGDWFCDKCKYVLFTLGLYLQAIRFSLLLLTHDLFNTCLSAEWLYSFALV